ncbi:hypothetical protein IEN85_06910 [Pelagicoccus sp. NFK12]|uniref:Coiled coil domain-containing protein n=2 Tax=Pelagicoccus enzymogenes TaxID=2773457 RepID=A0A927IH04_9BACT|nr:hypothetical protein [Pelagicoccus enzymogenes]MBD5779218.1 hypothetical protein [Pelagicoccus enzymogenes]MDQ8198428.1 hypothetical protein [Pelagicoccus enzymogenes]
MKAFSFEQKQAFSEAMSKQLVVIESEIQSLEAKMKNASDSVKAAGQPKLAELKERATSLKKQIAAIADATPTTWDGMKADSQKAYDALKHNVDESRQWLSDAIQPKNET